MGDDLAGKAAGDGERLIDAALCALRSGEPARDVSLTPHDTLPERTFGCCKSFRGANSCFALSLPCAFPLSQQETLIIDHDDALGVFLLLQLRLPVSEACTDVFGGLFYICGFIGASRPRFFHSIDETVDHGRDKLHVLLRRSARRRTIAVVCATRHAFLELNN